MTVKWISYDDAETDTLVNLGSLGGWFNAETHAYIKDEDGNYVDVRPLQKGDDRWQDFLDQFKEEGHPYLEALRLDITEKGLRHSGEYHQCGPDGTPVIDGTHTFVASYRGWGDLMAAVWSEKEGKCYAYIDFYMPGYIGVSDDE
tara:strand:- start:1024 stop:1458 length:435 start_codon:yes stop_codon:yes gene_type:complete